MMCPSGLHEFPIEDSTGAYCPEHGLTLLHNAPAGGLTAAPTNPAPADAPSQEPRPGRSIPNQ